MKIRAILFTVVAFLASSHFLLALPFGENKVRSKAFSWQILSTEHFDIYYYPEEEKLARRAALIAEKAYFHDTRVMDYFPKAKVPLFIFQNHLDFEQTNVTQDLLTEGVGGFTEPFKNRIVLPTTGSEHWLHTVIFHELTHAIQFDVLYGEGARSFHVLKNYLIPLWMTEGQAEFCAQNWDTFAEMVLRDGVLNERVKPLDLMEGFDHLEEVYLAYKAGQSAVQYLSDHYGLEKVALLMKKFKAQLATDQVIRDVTGKSLEEFSREWMAGLRQKYWVQASGKKAAANYGTALTHDTSQYLTSNNAPSWSPDGKKIAFVTTRNGFEQVWMMDASGREAKPLFKGPFEGIGRSGPLGVPGNRLSWSPDGETLAFIEASKGKDYLVLGSIHHHRLQKLDLGFDQMEAPRYSPDGKSIAFSGGHHGDTQIYLLDLQTRQVVAITQEKNASLLTNPAWSPDSKWLAYQAEVDGYNQLFLIRSNGTEGHCISQSKCNSIMPAFVPDGKKLFFCSDANGFYNLVESDLNGDQVKVLSDVVYGLFCPQPSPDGSKLLFVAYEDGCQNIYSMASPSYRKESISESLKALINPYLYQAGLKSIPTAVPTATSEATVNTLPPVPEAVSGNAEVGLPDAKTEPVYDAIADTAAASLLPSRPYSLNITPDLFFLLLGYDSLDGLLGEGYLTASDMLGEHNFTLYTDFVPGYQSEAQFNYLLLHGRVDTAFSLFYRKTNYPYYYNLIPQTALPTFYDEEGGGSVAFSYPFSRFSRLQWGLSSTYIYRNLSNVTVAPPEILSTIGSSLVNSLFVSIERDTSTYHAFEPLNGSRVNLSSSFSERFLGATRNFVFHQAELQIFQPLLFVGRDAVFSARFLGFEQNGNDRELFYFGGNLVRGLDYGEYLAEKFAVLNLEIRRPFIEDINYALWPLNFLLIKDVHLALFFDNGVAGYNWQDVNGPASLLSGYGGGIRLHTFLLERALLTWRFDIATRVRWDLNTSMDNTHYYFTLGTLF